MKSKIKYISSSYCKIFPLKLWTTLLYLLFWYLLQATVVIGNNTKTIVATNKNQIIQKKSYSIFDYFSDRGNDFLDIVSLDYGYGVGTSARISSWGTGLSIANIKGGFYNGHNYSVNRCDDYSCPVFGISDFFLSNKNTYHLRRDKKLHIDNIMFPPLVADPFLMIMASSIDLGGKGSNYNNPLKFLIGWPMIYVESIKQQPDIEVSAGFIPFGRFRFNFAELSDFLLGWTTFDFYKDDYHNKRIVIEKYPDDQVQLATTYRCNHPIGKWTSWYKNGLKKEEGFYNDIGKTSVWTYWNKNGIKASETEYFLNQKHGSSIYFYANGVIKEAGIFSNNHQQGVWIRWHKNGIKAQKANYINNHLDGKLINWYNNGTKATMRMYIDGNRDSMWNEWHPNGTIASKCTYNLNKRVGTNTWWYDTGVVSMVERHFTTNGVKGEYKIKWRKDGIKAEELLYIDWKLITRKRWDEKGGIIENKKFKQN